ncbi:MAG: Yip1 family protein, partial [Candidatus Aenigmatarchaeota archaeon]
MASDPRVLRYIREQMNAGFRKPEIYNALLEAGWYKEEIDQAFYEVANEIYGTTEPTPPPQAYPVKDVPQKPGFFWKFKNSLFHPGRLFDAIKSEEGFRGSLAFFGVIYFINIVITISVLFFAANVIDNLIKSELFSQLFQLMVFISMVNILDPLNILITYGFAFIATILGAGLIHIFVYIFGGRKGFHQTYKALMYSTAPSILFGVFLMLWVFVLFSSPEYILFAISLFLIPILWSLIIAIKGVSKLQEISGFRAAMGILTLPLIIFILFSFIFLFSFGVFNPSTYVARTATGFAEIGHPQDWAYNY